MESNTIYFIASGIALIYFIWYVCTLINIEKETKANRKNTDKIVEYMEEMIKHNERIERHHGINK